MRNTKIELNLDKLEVSSDLLRALAHPLRLKILKFIDSYEEINVNQIYNALSLEQSMTSQHLKILRSAGVVRDRRVGKYIHYSINYDKIGKALGAIRDFKEQK